MADLVPVSLGAPTFSASASAVISFTTDFDVDVGDHIIVVANRSGLVVGSEVTDDAGNTYQTDFEVEGANATVAVFSTRIEGDPLPAGSEITCTFPSESFTSRMLAAVKVSGVKPSDWFEDASDLFDSSFAAAFTTAGKANVVDGALLIGIGIYVGASDRTWESGAPWTEALDYNNPGDRGLSVQYQAVDSAASRSTDLTPSSSAAGIAVMLIYKASTALDFTIRLSGGAANDDPALSFGDDESTEIAGPDLFDTVSLDEATLGLVDYRLVYVHNEDDVESAVAVAWISNQLDGTTALALAVADEDAGETVPAEGDDVTAPAGVVFSAPATEGAGLELGEIGPGVGKGLWLRRTIDPETEAAPVDLARISISTAPPPP